MKKSVKILCLVMTIAMTLTSLPITAFALPLASNEKVSYETNDISQYISEDVYVMAEATEKRGEFEKHYILSDGSMVAVSYPEAVHYINESGKWEDVDNTFSYDYKSKRYVGGKGNTKFSFTESVSSGALVAIKDKHGTMEWSLGIIRNNKAEKGELSSTKAKVGEKIITEKATYSLNEIETFDLPKTVGKIQYDTLFTNAPEISVDYSVYHNKIEEDIYINSPTDLTSFTMDVQIGNLCGVVNKDGSVEFKNEAGEVIYRIGVPYMHDSADSVLNDITVTLDQVGDICTVTYTPNNEWLNSEDRAYPILFDPSITTSEYNSNITDTYVMQGDTANHSSQQTMYVGVKSGFVCRTYIKIGTLPAIDPSMPILSATMTLSLWASSSSGKTVGIYKANSSWSADTITYATQPTSTQLATCAFNASDLHYTFNLSNDVSEVYDEFLAGANYGYMLRYLDESTTDPDYNSIYSSEYTTKSYRPVLKIVYGYALPENLQSGSTYSLQNAGSASFMTVCDGIDANGTNVVQKYNEIADITTNQQFKLEYVSSTGGYLFRALCSSNGTNRVLDIAKNNGYVENGCNVQIYQNNDSIAQEWLIVGVDWDTFKIIPRTNMNLALTSYASFDDGSSSGTTASSTGNIFVSTYDEDNSYQRWYIIENGEYIEYESDSAKIVQNATYYINNEYSGQYIYNDGTSTVKAQAGLISDLADSIRWKITYVGNGCCTIQSTCDLTQYLGRTTGYALGYVNCTSSNNIPDSCLWTVEYAEGGGVHISFIYNSIKYYVTQASSGSIVAGGGITSSSTWRIASTAFYGNSVNCSMRELQSFSVSNIDMTIGQSSNININVSPNVLWSQYENYSVSDSDIVLYYDTYGAFASKSPGSASITVKHKVTGISTQMSIDVDDQIRTDSCYEGGTSNVLSKIGYSNRLAGSSEIIWSSSNPNVATVSSSGVVTGNMSGYSLICAETASGAVVLMCEFQVDDVRSSKLSVFTENEIQYLYCPTSYLNMLTHQLNNAFEYKVDFMYALRPYYTLPEDQHPSREEMVAIIKEEINLTLSEEEAGWYFYECYWGYLGRYNQEYLTALRIEYFNYLKEIVLFCAFGMASNLDPVNTVSNCNGYDDLVIDLSNEWSNNSSSSNVMLGSNGYQGKYYYNEAKKLGYRYFYSPNYDYYYSEFGADFVRSVNTRFLQNCINSNCSFYFCNDPRTAPITSSLHMEYSYLLNYYTNLWGSAYLKQLAGLWYFSPTP